MNTREMDLIDFWVGLILFNISMIFTLFILIISLKLRFHTKFSSELIIYVLISESLNSLSKDCFLIPKKHVFQNIILILLSYYLNSLTLVSILFHTIKIYDAIIRESQWFIKRKIRICTRIFIFSFALVLTCLPIGIAFYVNEKNITCTGLFCHIVGYLILVPILIEFTIFVVMFSFILYSYCFLKKSLRQKQSYSKMITKTINRMTWKVWLFPIATFIYWVFQTIWDYLLSEEPLFSIRLIKTIIASLSAALYALLFVYTQDNLKFEIKKRLCCCLKYKDKDSFIFTDSEDSIELSKEFLDEERENNEIIPND